MLSMLRTQISRLGMARSRAPQALSKGEPGSVRSRPLADTVSLLAGPPLHSLHP